jgi:hypothetical protein
MGPTVPMVDVVDSPFVVLRLNDGRQASVAYQYDFNGALYFDGVGALE